MEAKISTKNTATMKITPLTQEELINEVETVHRDFSKALSQFSNGKFNTVPYEGSWTAGQVTEHIIKSRRGILTQLLDGPMKAADRPYDQMAKTMQDIFRDMESKAKSDERIVPGPPPHDLRALLHTLERQKERQKIIIKTKNLEEFSTELEFPGIGQLSRYEWIHMMIEHDQRHRRQIDNIYKNLS
jgi:uncharacterized damage-inducible protein DinB